MRGWRACSSGRFLCFNGSHEKHSMTSGAPRMMVLVVILRGTRGDNLAASSCMVRRAVIFCCRFPGRPLCLLRRISSALSAICFCVTITLKQHITLVEKLPIIWNIQGCIFLLLFFLRYDGITAKSALSGRRSRGEEASRPGPILMSSFRLQMTDSSTEFAAIACRPRP